MDPALALASAQETESIAPEDTAPQFNGSDNELACPECDFIGSSPRGLKRHMTVAHGIKADSDKSRTPRTPKLEKSLAEFYALIGMSVSLINPYDGQLILENAENCAKSLDKLAQENAAVRRVLTRLVTGSAVGAVVVAHAPIVLGLAMNHLPFLQRPTQEADTES